jgi:8-oxo-dGTP diphosphatase
LVYKNGEEFHLIIENNHGWMFLDFIKLNEDELDSYSSIAGSYAVIKREEKFLLCYNVWRKQWEVPAGKREKGETAEECAYRELNEETGQTPAKLDFEGLMKVKKVDGSIKYNPVFTGILDELQPFRKNEETSAIILWDLEQGIGSVDEVDYELLKILSGKE